VTEEQWKALTEQDRYDHLTGRMIREALARGDKHFAIGHPLGKGWITIIEGSITWDAVPSSPVHAPQCGMSDERWNGLTAGRRAWLLKNLTQDAAVQTAA
jgi:hypothetical protein